MDTIVSEYLSAVLIYSLDFTFLIESFPCVLITIQTTVNAESCNLQSCVDDFYIEDPD